MSDSVSNRNERPMSERQEESEAEYAAFDQIDDETGDHYTTDQTALEFLRNRIEAADALAAGVKSFLESLAFQPPEAVGFQARVKLAEPLAGYKALSDESELTDGD